MLAVVQVRAGLAQALRRQQVSVQVNLDTPTMIANPGPRGRKRRRGAGASDMAAKRKRTTGKAAGHKHARKSAACKSKARRRNPEGTAPAKRKKRKKSALYSMKRTKSGYSIRRRKHRNPGLAAGPVLQSAIQLGGGAAAAIFLGAIGAKLLAKFAPTFAASNPTLAKAAPPLIAAAAGLALAKFAKSAGLKQAGKAAFAAGIVLAVNELAKTQIEGLASKLGGYALFDGTHGQHPNNWGAAGFMEFDGMGGYQQIPDMGQPAFAGTVSAY